ncbi:protein kinase domain-containing protein [Oxalobacteraceae bacterium A2-2]
MTDSDDDRTVLAPGHTLPPRALPVAHSEGGGNALAKGTRLGEFDITEVLGEGGFGIVYLAYDHTLERHVALKEYMPSAFASRSATMQVSVKSEREADTFDAGLRSFVNEARILAQFDHPSLIKVYRFWEAHGTAYMVMPYYQGATLKQTLLARSAPPDEAWLKALLAPLLDTLSLIHAHQCFHRDIAPDNIMMLNSGRPLLLDFGAARRAVEGMQQAFTVIFKQNYAPIEQYAEMPGMTQGPWTDLYALASVVHFAMTGAPPPPAVGRLVQDPYVPLASRYADSFSASFLRAIDQALAVKPEDRPQSAAAMREMLGLAEGYTEIAPSASTAPAKAAPPVAAAPAPVPAGGKRGLLLAAGAVALAAMIAAGVFLSRDKPEPALAAAPSAVPTLAPTVQPAAAAPALEPFNPLAALQQVLDGASAERGVSVTTDKSRVRINKDKLGFSIHASRAGYVYVQMVGTDRNNFYLLYPNALDKNNYIKAGQTLVLPGAGWHLAAGGPAGIDQFVAIVSDTPRTFEAAGLTAVPGQPFSEFPIAQAQALQRAYTGSTPLFAGAPKCAAGGECSPTYGATKFSIEEVAP